MKNLEMFASMASHDVLMGELTMTQAVNKCYYLTKQYEKVTRKLVKLYIEKNLERSKAAFIGHEEKLEMLRRNLK